MLSSLVRLPLARVLICIVLVDAMVTGVAHVTHLGDPPHLPYFRTVVADSGANMADFTHLPESTDGLPPDATAVTQDGGIRRVDGGQETFDPDLSARFVIDTLDDPAAVAGSQAVRRAELALADVLRHREGGMVMHEQNESDVADGLPRGWVSAKTQGLVLSALARAYRVTGKTRWARAADATFDTFLRIRDITDEDGHKPVVWITFRDAYDFLWFEQYPQLRVPSQRLTGHDYAMLGLSDFAAIASGGRRVAAQQLFAGGAATVAHYAIAVRRPFMAARISPITEERSLSEHRLITAQLLALAQVSGRKQFDRWARYYLEDSELPEFPAAGIEPRQGIGAYGALPGSVRASAASRAEPIRALGRVLDALAVYQRTRDRDLLRQAEATMATIEPEIHDGFLAHRTSAVDAAGNQLSMPWYSARTQGLLLSDLVRLSSATGNQRWADLADDVFDSFRHFRGYPGNGSYPPQRWVSLTGNTRDGGYLWFTGGARPAKANAPVTRELAVQLTALFGIYDYWSRTKSVVAQRLFVGGATTLHAQIARTGQTTGARGLGDQRLIARQFNVLSRMTGLRDFAIAGAKMAEEAP
jgi:hypothetical protein